jgi:hypothetical protein
MTTARRGKIRECKNPHCYQHCRLSFQAIPPGRKRIHTMAKVVDHLTDDVLPGLVDGCRWIDKILASRRQPESSASRPPSFCLWWSWQFLPFGQALAEVCESCLQSTENPYARGASPFNIVEAYFGHIFDRLHSSIDSDVETMSHG